MKRYDKAVLISTAEAAAISYYLRRVVPRGADEANELGSLIDGLEQADSDAVQRRLDG
jgi:hypothetical protein